MICSSKNKNKKFLLKIWKSNNFFFFSDTATKFGSLPSLGVRKKEGKSVGPYEWITYNELKKRRDDLGSGLALLGQTKGSPVGIYSINRPEV